MVFDSSIIIVTTNLNPKDKAQACGLDNEEAMYRRFTDTCGAYEIPDKKIARNNMTEHFVHTLAQNIEHHLDVTIDVGHVIRTIPGIRNCTYSTRTCMIVIAQNTLMMNNFFFETLSRTKPMLVGTWETLRQSVIL